MSFKTILSKHRTRINHELDLTLSTKFPNYDIAKEFVLRKGKRIRPIATILAYEAVGGSGRNIHYPATSVELFHDSTLVHDDVMDEDDKRRGLPSVHKLYEKQRRPGQRTKLFNSQAKQFAVSNAIADGCILYALGADAILSSSFDFEKKCLALDYYNKASINVQEGQKLDISGKIDGQVEYIAMVGKKTGDLFAASFAIGAVLGGAEKKIIDLLYDYGRNVGIGFQIADDLLDIGDVKGRERGSDIRNGKQTLLTIISCRNANTKQKRVFRKAYGNLQVTKRDLCAAISVLEDTAVEQAKMVAGSYLYRALESHKDAGFSAKKDEDNLLKLANYLINRKI